MSCFSDVLVPVKDLGNPLQNNLFDIVDAIMHWHIQKHAKFPKHWSSYIQKHAQKQKRHLPKHKNNKLCLQSRFTYQKCNPIQWTDCQLSPKILQRLNRINARCFTNFKFTSVVSTCLGHKIWGHILKVITSNRKCCCAKSSTVRKSQLFKQDGRI